MTVPSAEDWAEAQRQILKRGAAASETIALGILAIRDPTLGPIVDRQVAAAIKLLKTPEPELMRGILSGVFILALDLALTAGQLPPK